MPYEIHNYGHNNEWLCRSLQHVGRVREAVDLAKNMVELPRHPDERPLLLEPASEPGRALVEQRRQRPGGGTSHTATPQDHHGCGRDVVDAEALVVAH